MICGPALQGHSLLAAVGALTAGHRVLAAGALALQHIATHRRERRCGCLLRVGDDALVHSVVLLFVMNLLVSSDSPLSASHP